MTTTELALAVAPKIGNRMSQIDVATYLVLVKTSLPRTALSRVFRDDDASKVSPLTSLRHDFKIIDINPSIRAAPGLCVQR